MYTVALTPILVGSLAARSETAYLSLPSLLLFLLAAFLIIAWLNLTNDVFDFDTGIDVHKRESVVNLCGATRQARNLVLLLATLFLLTAFASLAALCRRPLQTFDPTVLALIAVAVAGGYMYQGPPFRLGYYGLGEPICFITWTISVCAAYYSQLVAHPPTARVLEIHYPTLLSRLRYVLVELLFSRTHYLFAAALLVATPTAIILLCSHFHQLEDDKRTGKRSPIVRLGTKLCTMVLEAALVAFLFAEFVLYGVGMLPAYPFYLSLLAAPYALQLANFVRQNHEVPEAVRPAKYYAVKFHFVHGVLVSLGYLLTKPVKDAVW